MNIIEAGKRVLTKEENWNRKIKERAKEGEKKRAGFEQKKLKKKYHRLGKGMKRVSSFFPPEKQKKNVFFIKVKKKKGEKRYYISTCQGRCGARGVA